MGTGDQRNAERPSASGKTSFYDLLNGSRHANLNYKTGLEEKHAVTTGGGGGGGRGAGPGGTAVRGAG